MNKSQATRVTQKQLAYLSYWKARGYEFRRGESIPETTSTPPGLAATSPVTDAVLGSLILAASIGSMMAMWVKIGSGL